MKVKRVLRAAEMMLEVHRKGGCFKMDVFQECGGGSVCRSTAELLKAGRGACFAGWLAVSEDFREKGGLIGRCGEPMFNGDECAGAVGDYFGIRSMVAYPLVYGGSAVYQGKEPHEITALDVADELVLMAKLHVKRNMS